MEPMNEQMSERLARYVREAMTELKMDPKVFFSVEFPAELAHGDYATNIALVAAKNEKKNPRVLAEEVVGKLKAKNDPDIADISVAGEGFINFRLSEGYVRSLGDRVARLGEWWGRNEELKGKKVIVEYTDPNPFKEFHIGHLMSNAVGESVSRLIEASGADTKRACYQGDVGLHVAKTVWAMNEGEQKDSKHFQPRISQCGTLLSKKAKYLGAAYAFGAVKYADEISGQHGGVREAVEQINKMLYDRSNPAMNELYEWGRMTSLEYFEEIYKRLGTDHGDGKAFNFYFFESETGPFGKELVEKNIGTIFEKSDGAVVYKGDEAIGLHTRVFINKDGLPTYEAKELGLAKVKYDKFAYDISIVITGNEVNDYFKVLLDAMAKVFPDLAKKTEHYSHGMLRLPTGKMSSRTGDVIAATTLIDKAKHEIKTRVADATDAVAEAAAIAAVKYSILRQAAGKDVIFDFEQSISFEGDSGPYLEYTNARARSVLEKAGGAPVDAAQMPVNDLARLLLRFPEVVSRAANERAPHHVANYLVDVARDFNSYYGNTMILDGAPDQPGKLALVRLVAQTLANGLWLLGIPSPDRM